MQFIVRSRMGILLSLPAICLVALVGFLNAATAESLPDYALEQLYVAPAVPEVGEEVSFHATVRNIGVTRGIGYDYARLWIDSLPSNSLAYIGGLPVGSTQSVQWGTTGTNPQMPWRPVAGTHTMRICLHQPNSRDAEAPLFDANSINDCASLTFTVPGGTSQSTSSVRSSSSSMPSTTGIPDFAMQDLRFYQDTAGYAMTVVVKNIGAGTDKWAHVRLDIDSTRDVMGYGIKPLVQNATDTAVWSSSVLRPRNGWLPTPGSHYATACIDNENGIPADGNAANNCKSLSFTIAGTSSMSSIRPSSSSSVRSGTPSTSGLPDFEITAMNVVPSGETGKINAWATVKNRGSDATILSYIILEHRQVGETGWQSIVPAREVRPLPANGEASGEWENHGRGLQGTYTFRDGTYEFRACADAWNLIIETDEHNCYPPMRVVFGAGGASSVSSRSSAISSSSSSVRSRSSRNRQSTQSTNSSSEQRSSNAGLTDTSLPNLILRGVSVTPASFAAGGRWGAKATVANTGATPSVATTVQLKIDEFNDGDEDYVSSVEMVVPSLQPGRQFTVTWSNRGTGNSIDWTAIPGRHRVILCVNERRESPEWNYDDNCAKKTVNVKKGRSSSSVSSRSSSSSQRSQQRSSSLSSTVSAVSSRTSSRTSAAPSNYLLEQVAFVPSANGVTYEFSATVVNVGPPTSVRTVLRLSFDYDSNGSFDTSLSQTIPGISEDGAHPVRLINIQMRPLGRHTIIACADDANVLQEPNETDNCVSFQVTVAHASSASFITAPPEDQYSSSRMSSSSQVSSSSRVSSNSSVRSVASSSASSMLPNHFIYSMNVEPLSTGRVNAIGMIRNTGANTPVSSFAILQYSLYGTGEWITVGTRRAIRALLTGGDYEIVDWTNVGLAGTNDPFPAGQHRMRLCADSTNIVAERSEVDNCGPVGFTIPVR